MSETQRLCVKEVWMPVEGWPYAVSSWGRVKRTKSAETGPTASEGHILKPVIRSNGYLFATLYKALRVTTGDRRKWNSESKQVAVHRLVAEAFLGKCPKDIQVNHIDGNKANNHLVNLEYVTPGQNKAHSYKIGLSNAEGSNNGKSLFNDKDIIKIRQLAASMLADGSMSVLAISKILSAQFDVSLYTIKHIIQGTRWDHLPNKAKELIKKKILLEDRQVDKIKMMFNNGITATDISQQLNIPVSKVRDIIYERSYVGIGTIKSEYVSSRLTEEKIKQIKTLFQQFSHKRPMERYRALSNLFGVSISRIKRIINGKTWACGACAQSR